MGVLVGFVASHHQSLPPVRDAGSCSGAGKYLMPGTYGSAASDCRWAQAIFRPVDCFMLCMPSSLRVWLFCLEAIHHNRRCFEAEFLR